MTIAVTPIARVSSQRTEIRDDHWGDVESRFELSSEFDEEAWAGIEDFSHVEVVYFFDRVDEACVEGGARHPRGNSAWPRVGIFAQRGKDRPNRLGISVAELVRREGRVLWVRGLDAIDGTPVIDVKPVMEEFLPRGAVRQPAWSRELMARFWE